MKQLSFKHIVTNVLLLSLLISVFSYPKMARAENNGLAVSVGMDYGDDVDTTEDAKDASSAYSEAGYSTDTLTSPVKSSFTETRLQAEILFFSGHANPNLMSFDSFYIYCNSGSSSDNVNLWNTASYQKLITFAGCNTAGGDSKKNGGGGSSTDCITKRAVDQGADVAVGWTTTVSAGSHTNWLRRYNNALAEGYTVSGAINKANSYIYLPGSGVKNVQYYGDGDVVITSSKSTKTVAPSNTFILTNENNAVIVNDIIYNVLENNGYFNTNNYTAYASETNNGYTIDVYYKCNGILTNVAITIQLNAKKNITDINTYNFPAASLDNIPSALQSEAPQIAAQTFKTQTLALELNRINQFEKVAKQTQYEYYDITNKTTYLITYTETVDDYGAKYVYENCIEIQ